MLLALPVAATALRDKQLNQDPLPLPPSLSDEALTRQHAQQACDGDFFARLVAHLKGHTRCLLRPAQCIERKLERRNGGLSRSTTAAVHSRPSKNETIRRTRALSALFKRSRCT